MVRSKTPTGRVRCTSSATALSLWRSTAGVLRTTRRKIAAAPLPVIDRGRTWSSRVIVAAPAILSLLGRPDIADAQTCTVSGSSTVTLSSGSCSIATNTTLNGSPAVHATTSAQISTNNVTINPFNGGSTGALAETLGTITFNAGSSINGNWATGASAQTGGQIVFQSGSAINPPFGGGETALIATGVNATTGRPSEIIATGRATHSYFGLQTAPISAESAAQAGVPQGLFVAAVVAGSPAASAGLREGDVITKVNGQAATSNVQLQELTLTKEPGDKVSVDYTRDGKAGTTTVTLGTTP